MVDLVKHIDPILRYPCAKVPLDKEHLEYRRDIMTKLYDTMIEKNGLGLAANQIGINAQAFCITGFDTPECSVFFNPVIEDYSADTIQMEEGCLSFPGLILPITRPVSVRIKYYDVEGNPKDNHFGGMTARIIQHEIDHCAGTLYYNRASLYHREKFLKHWRREHGPL